MPNGNDDLPLTWEEVESFGIEVQRLGVGDKFVNVVKEGEVVGTVKHKGVGGVIVEYMRGPKDPVTTVWAPEAKVIRVKI